MKLDPSALRQLEEDVGPEVLPAILQQFYDELEHRARTLTAALDAVDLLGVKAEAHALKSTARSVGLNDVADAAAAAESAARDVDEPRALELGRRLTVLCREGREALGALI